MICGASVSRVLPAKNREYLRFVFVSSIHEQGVSRKFYITAPYFAPLPTIHIRDNLIETSVAFLYGYEPSAILRDEAELRGEVSRYNRTID